MQIIMILKLKWQRVNIIKNRTKNNKNKKIIIKTKVKICQINNTINQGNHYHKMKSHYKVLNLTEIPMKIINLTILLKEISLLTLNTPKIKLRINKSYCRILKLSQNLLPLIYTNHMHSPNTYLDSK